MANLKRLTARHRELHGLKRPARKHFPKGLNCHDNSIAVDTSFGRRLWKTSDLPPRLISLAPSREVTPVTNSPILPGSTVGVLGSGQLGRMFALAARRMGYRVHTYSPDSDTPTGQVADLEINAPYDDLDQV